MKIYAVYRCLYGEDFIQESIAAIEPYVDKVIVIWSDVPWGNVQEVQYKGDTVVIPKQIDNIIQRIKGMPGEKIHLIHDNVFTPENQFTHFMDDIVLANFEMPTHVMFLEPDMVFKKQELELTLESFDNANLITASTKQIELWRNFDHRIPARVRPGCILWNMKWIGSVFPPTGKSCNYVILPYLPSMVHNFGFCVSDRSMYWKHLLAMGFSEKINDSPPNPEWLEKKWHAWNGMSNNRDLEVSLGKEYEIPCAIYYDRRELPETILEGIAAGKWSYMEHR